MCQYGHRDNPRQDLAHGLLGSLWQGEDLEPGLTQSAFYPLATGSLGVL